MAFASWTISGHVEPSFTKSSIEEAVDDDGVAHGLTDSADDLDGELNPRGVVAPLVRALVGLGDDELVDEVALGPHDLDAVVARLLRSLGAVDVVGDGLLYTSGGERTRLEGVMGAFSAVGATAHGA